MATTINLPFWPCALDCVSWSDDNVICVVGGENIAILTPCLKGSGTNGKHWDTALIQVNTFTQEEVPLHQPLSNKTFSIGDELCVRQAVLAKWSAPGLARHRGCALAVLTADHTLSIWAADGNHKNTRNWKRQVIINHAIRDYYAEKASRDDLAGKQPLVNTAVVQQRVLSFAWSPRVCVRDNKARAGEEKQFLAVATEEGDIMFLRVGSPWEPSTSDDQSWSAHVTEVVSVSMVATTAMQNAKVRPLHEPPHFATDLEWGRWRSHEHHGPVANMAFIADGRLFSILVRSFREEDVVGVNALSPENGRWDWHLQEHSDLRGPLQRGIKFDEADGLVVFGDDKVIHLAITLEGTAQNESHHLDGRWDAVSGVAFTDMGALNPCLHITSELSSATAATAALSLPFSSNDTMPEASWQYAIKAAGMAYGADLDLGGNVNIRTCGIDSSPLCDFVATCTFFQPSDAVAYVIEAARSCVLSISLEHKSTPGAVLPLTRADRTSSSVESVLFSIQRYLERRRIETSLMRDDETAMRQALQQEMISVFRNTSKNEHATFSTDRDSGDMETEALIENIRSEIYGPSEVQAARAARLIDLALGYDGQKPPIDGKITQHLLETVLRYQVHEFALNRKSTQMRGLFTTILARLTSQGGVARVSSGEQTSEVCRLCDQDIPFEGLRWAKCLKGHQFSRCALSFLAIQQPGITKSCGICGLQYFDETKITEFSTEDDGLEMVDIPHTVTDASISVSDTWVEISRKTDHAIASKATLVQVLFAACDSCIHCGGRYIDER